MVAPLADQQQLCQAGGKDGAAQQGAAEDERQEEAVVPLHSTNSSPPSAIGWTSGMRLVTHSQQAMYCEPRSGGEVGGGEGTGRNLL